MVPFFEKILLLSFIYVIIHDIITEAIIFGSKQLIIFVFLRGDDPINNAEVNSMLAIVMMRFLELGTLNIILSS